MLDELFCSSVKAHVAVKVQLVFVCFAGAT